MKRLVFLCVLIITPISNATNFNDGKTHNIDYSLAEVKVESQTTVNILDGASIADFVHVFHNSQVNVLGGYIGGDVTAWGSSVVNLSDGYVVDQLNGYNNSRIYLTGGQIATNCPPPYDINLSDQAVLTIEGSNFLVNGIPVGAGIIRSSGTLSGILANGDTIDVEFYTNDGAHIVLIPEPATLLLLGLGGLILRKKLYKL